MIPHHTSVALGLQELAAPFGKVLSCGNVHPAVTTQEFTGTSETSLMAASESPDPIQRIISGQEAMGIGAQLLEKLQTVAPITHRRWASQYLNGVAQ